MFLIKSEYRNIQLPEWRCEDTPDERLNERGDQQFAVVVGSDDNRKGSSY